jgi:hypothetical protein
MDGQDRLDRLDCEMISSLTFMPKRTKWESACQHNFRVKWENWINHENQIWHLSFHRRCLQTINLSTLLTSFEFSSVFLCLYKSFLFENNLKNNIKIHWLILHLLTLHTSKDIYKRLMSLWLRLNRKLVHYN